MPKGTGELASQTRPAPRTAAKPGAERQRERGVGDKYAAHEEIDVPGGERVIDLGHQEPEQDEGVRKRWRRRRGAHQGRGQRHQDGDLGQFREARVEGDIAGLEQAVGARRHPHHLADGQTRRKFTAESGRDEAARRVGLGVDVERNELDQAAGRPKGRIEAPLVGDHLGVTLDEGGQPHFRAADQFDDGSVGVDFADPSDHAAGEDDRARRPGCRSCAPCG